MSTKAQGRHVVAEMFHPLTRQHHPDTDKCPGCGDDLARVALIELVYTFETCECRAGEISYDHLVEQLWHRRCFLTDRTVKA